MYLVDVTFSPSKRHLALRPSLLVTGARNWHHLNREVGAATPWKSDALDVLQARRTYPLGVNRRRGSSLGPLVGYTPCRNLDVGVNSRL